MVGMVPPASSSPKSQNPVSCRPLEAHHGVSAQGRAAGGRGAVEGRSRGGMQGRGRGPLRFLVANHAPTPTQQLSNSATQPPAQPSTTHPAQPTLSTSQPEAWDIVCKSLAITRRQSTSRISNDQHAVVHALSLKSVRGLHRPELDERVHRGRCSETATFCSFCGSDMEALLPRDMQSFIRVGARTSRASGTASGSPPPPLLQHLVPSPELYRALDASCGCAATAGLFCGRERAARPTRNPDPAGLSQRLRGIGTRGTRGTPTAELR
ncbi:uncharacterized protein B0H64DRAFT_212106 [Chaetomium fimeti]|uniref:Uncharacterized protein n=1 Tax=Chaetomium fimeti TaxID=1854472 RepID=A0AAE0LQQ9_9PEZI|nr:hypothetical protein B0H64DRAFT_212106 [Chaetomium fimeti]